VAASGPDPRFTHHVDRQFDDLEQLFEAGDDARDILRHPGWTTLDALLRAEVATIDRRLEGSDEPLTQAQYAMAHGRRGGLLAAHEALQAVIYRAESRMADERAKHEGAAESASDGSN
jgi:hypothetical protein